MSNRKLREITQAIILRSANAREEFVENCQMQASLGKSRRHLSCGNLAHAVASNTEAEKGQILDSLHSNLAIISSYNDMVSAHSPYQEYPNIIKQALKPLGHTAQVAGGVPAMCDGVTQGQAGMDMSLFSRDLIAQSTALSLSHNMFDGALLLGVCDKIAPGMLIGALSHGHLPTSFVPSGLMPSGISNNEKVKIRQQFAKKEVSKNALLEMECNAYHSPGICTFYGTANTNQVVFESMGLMLPGSSLVAPNQPLRQQLTKEVALRIAASVAQSGHNRPLYQVVTPQSIVNGVVALLASGGSTNHTIHMVAVARAAGIDLRWKDIDALSRIVPLLVNVYPNGSADMNAFQEAGGVPALLVRLHQSGLLNEDVMTSFGDFESLFQSPSLENNTIRWTKSQGSQDTKVISPKDAQFMPTGGIQILTGNIGNCVIKVSAIEQNHQFIKAPAKVFHCQHEVEKAYQQGELNQDCVVVVTHNGPSANGMPELHKLMPILGNVQKQGYQIALITDGRLSGASGKVPSAIHISPEAVRGGNIGLIENGDIICLDCQHRTLNNLTAVKGRKAKLVDKQASDKSWGRGLFNVARENISSAEEGASYILS